MAALPSRSVNFLKTGAVNGLILPARYASSHEVVIAGGGTGGISVAARLARALGKDKVAVIEPSNDHYYQPMWTMVGAGLKPLSATRSAMSDVMPNGVKWIQNKVAKFNPDENTVQLEDGEEVSYKYLVVAMGINLHFEKIKGLPDALETPGVCSNYSSETVMKTLEALKNFKEGNAIFTFPSSPIKCPGAPQKIMYLAEEFLAKHGKRDKANIMFNSAGAGIFAVKKYAESLSKVVAKRGITTNFGLNLVEVNTDAKEAIFAKVANAEETVTFPYEMLHITPPMATADAIKTSPLADAAGFVDVNSKTTQHKKFPNVFALGDCTNLPTSRTAAAVACQNKILSNNLLQHRENKPQTMTYDGYTSCPLLTASNSCILAEFDYNLEPLETFPINQGKERRTMYTVKSTLLPFVYWNMLLKGRWGGPGFYRKLMHLGMSK